MSSAVPSSSRRYCTAALLAVALVAGCKGKDKAKKVVAPPIAGMAAVPASAEVVLSVHVPAVASAPLVTRAIGQLLARDSELTARWNALQASCKIDVTAQVDSLIIAVGASAAGQRPALLVATGKLVEADLASCVRALVGTGGGKLSAEDRAGRTLYKATDGGRTVYFTFGQPDTVLFSASETLLNDAIGTGPRFQTKPGIAEALTKVDSKQPLWGVGNVDARVGQGLIKATGGQVAAGPSLMRVEVDPSEGLAGKLVLVMASEKDATALETFVTSQLSLMAMASQVASLGQVVAKIKVARDGAELSLSAALTNADLNHVLSAIDSLWAAEQDAVPSAPGAALPPSDAGAH